MGHGEKSKVGEGIAHDLYKVLRLAGSALRKSCRFTTGMDCSVAIVDSLRLGLCGIGINQDARPGHLAEQF